MADQDFDIKIRTTADTAGAEKASIALARIEEQSKKTQAAAGGAAGTTDVTQFGNVIGRLIGLASGAVVYRLIEQITLTANELNKVSDELEKQGNQLTENAMKHAEAANFAKTEADVIKIGEAALKDVEATHKNVLELAKSEYNTWEQILDAINKFELSFSYGAQSGVNEIEEAKKALAAAAATEEDTRRRSAIYDVQAAKTHEARRAAQSYSAQIEELNQRIKEQKALADTHWQQGDIASYLAVARTLENLKKELQDVIKEQERFRANLEKTGGADIGGKLTPGGEVGQLGQQLQQLGGLKNLTPVEEKAARDAFIATEKELRDKQIQGEKDLRDAQIKAQRDRYEGIGLPVMKPGESQSQYNAELLTAIRQLADLWK